MCIFSYSLAQCVYARGMKKVKSTVFKNHDKKHWLKMLFLYMHKYFPFKLASKIYQYFFRPITFDLIIFGSWDSYFRVKYRLLPNFIV